MATTSLSHLENETLQRRPIKEEIFTLLHRRVIAGKYRPGEWLRQEEIASTLGVSMTPVREALDLLVAAGLAERVPYRGVRVLELSNEEILDSYVMRLVLERAIARAAAISIKREQLGGLEEMLQQMQPLVTLNDLPALQQINREFHLLVARAGGNALLTRLYETASNTFPDWMLYEAMFRHEELLSGYLAEEYEQHRRLVAALAAGDPKSAEECALAHVLKLGEEMSAVLNLPMETIRERARVALD
jgi:DNA-binding GntR family transcriptional regulator